MIIVKIYSAARDWTWPSGYDAWLPSVSSQVRVSDRIQADTYIASLNMTMLQFDEKWNIIYDSLRHFEDGY